METTRTSILDAAEELFAQFGYHGTSLQRIAQLAEIPTASITYHFKTKENLFSCVIERRAELLSRDRLSALEAISGEYSDPRRRLEAIIDAYVRPFSNLSVRGGKGWKSYTHLIAQITSSRELGHITYEFYDPVARKFIKAIADTLPGLSTSSLQWAFSFFVGAMVMALAETDRIAGLSDGAVNPQNLDEACAKMVLFVAGGFRRLFQEDINEA